MSDSVNKPPHYQKHPSGVECITITEHFNFNLGNAIKYIWRSGEKGKTVEDLKKAAWYINREIERLTKPAESFWKQPPPKMDDIGRQMYERDMARAKQINSPAPLPSSALVNPTCG